MFKFNGGNLIGGINHQTNRYYVSDSRSLFLTKRENNYSLSTEVKVGQSILGVFNFYIKYTNLLNNDLEGVYATLNTVSSFDTIWFFKDHQKIFKKILDDLINGHPSYEYIVEIDKIVYGNHIPEFIHYETSNGNFVYQTNNCFERWSEEIEKSSISINYNFQINELIENTKKGEIRNGR